MKTLRVIFGVLAMTVALSARGSVRATETLRSALNQLIAAGNYSWQEARDNEVDGRRTGDPSMFGQTVVDGFTVATADGTELVAFEKQMVFKFDSGWRRAAEVTPQEMRAARQRATGAPRATPPRVFFTASYTPVHDVLRWLVRNAADLREQDGAIVGEVPASDENYLQGTPPPTKSRLPDGVARRADPKAADSGRPDGTLRVWLSGGQIVKFSVEFSRTNSMANPANARAPRTTTRTYTVELYKIGTTKVEVPAEARVALEK